MKKHSKVCKNCLYCEVKGNIICNSDPKAEIQAGTKPYLFCWFHSLFLNNLIIDYCSTFKIRKIK